MILQTWGDATTNALQVVWQNVIVSLPNILLALILFFVGWILAVVAQKVVVQIFKALKVDQGLEKLGAGDTLSKAGLKLDVGKWVGFLVKWFFIFVALLAASDVLKLSAVTDFFKEVVLYIPDIVVAAVILIVGVWFAGFIQKLIMASISASQIKMASFVGTIIKWAIIVFALFTALEHVRIASSILQMLIMGFIAMLAIAGGLAFGLGGKDYASKSISKIKEELSE